MYTQIKLANGLLSTYDPVFGYTLWGDAKTRKPHRCEVCEDIYPTGSIMFRPIGNGFNRMHRICEGCAQMYNGD